jgi:hypothetical protein
MRGGVGCRTVDLVRSGGKRLASARVPHWPLPYAVLPVSSVPFRRVLLCWCVYVVRCCDSERRDRNHGPRYESRLHNRFPARPDDPVYRAVRLRGRLRGEDGVPGRDDPLRYRGPAPTVLLGASSAFCGYNLSVNGWEPVAIRPPEGRSELPLPSGPAEGRLGRRARAATRMAGRRLFLRLRLPAGCELLPPPPCRSAS